jgi:hypothetical protein
MYPKNIQGHHITQTAGIGKMNPYDVGADAQLLTDAGIPHTIYVLDDYDVDATDYHTRFTADGTLIKKVIEENEYLLSVSSLHELLDKPEELRALITQQHDALQVLPWDNQLEYSIPARVAARMTGSHK